jgi:ATP-dependent Clp protease ATP-binding subunit ClpC
MAGLRFERFTEQSNKVLLFARLSLCRYGGDYIRSEHLLLGILQATPATVVPFIAAEWSAKRMLEDLVDRLPRGSYVSEEVEVPFDQELDRALERAVQTADTFRNRDILPEHLLLALVSEDVTSVGQLLREAGIAREPILRFLQQL